MFASRDLRAEEIDHVAHAMLKMYGVKAGSLAETYAAQKRMAGDTHGRNRWELIQASIAALLAAGQR